MGNVVECGGIKPCYLLSVETRLCSHRSDLLLDLHLKVIYTMKSTFTLWALLFFLAVPGVAIQAQVFQLTVNNGYTQANQVAAGDTVHLWAQEWGLARTFSHWEGDTSFLERPLEWHTRIIMPAQDVTLTAVTPVLPTGTANPLTLENIMGRDTLKRVFSYFPANAPPAGVCWLWHGTGGSASSWAGGEFEQHQFVKYLVSKGWGVIVTESEESTKDMDLSGDGNLRYDYTPDTLNNVDLENVRAIRDTFINRGKFSWSTPQASLGFSAGGAFSTLLAPVLGWQAAVSHSSGGVTAILPFIETPILYSMNLLDDHPDVGWEGNLEAFHNWQYLDSAGVCSEFYLQRPSPTYPARFKRFPGITTSLSASINNELVGNGCFGQGGYMIKSPGEIELAVISNPSNWPVVLGLTGPQRQFVLDQLRVMWTSHHYHSDFMAADFAFISNPCGTAVPALEPEKWREWTLYPNPAKSWIQLPESAKDVQVYNMNGVLVMEQKGVQQSTLPVAGLPPGMYLLQSGNAWGKFMKQ